MSVVQQRPSGILPSAHARLKQWPRRLAWLPIPILLLAVVAFRFLELHVTYASPSLVLTLNFLTRTLVTFIIMYLAGRSFLARRAPAVLLLGCGVAIWGATGFLASAWHVVDANFGVTVTNMGAFLAALCHVAGGVLSLTPRRTIRAPGLWLTAAYALALSTAAGIAVAAFNNWLPLFFVQDQGGTLLRHLVLLSSIVMFVLAAGLMLAAQRPSSSSFTRWYAAALLLIAVGLVGMMLQTTRYSLLDWTCRFTQYLGALYMLTAAIASARETGVWEITLGASHRERLLGLLNDRLLRFMAPRYLTALPRPWRYALAVGIAAAATLLRLALIPWMGTTASYNIALIAAVSATLLLGIGPGVVTVLLCDVAVEIFVLGSTPAFFHAATLARLGTSVGIGVFVACTLHAIRVSQIRTRRSEEKFSTLFHAAPFAMTLTTYPDGVLYEVNRAWREWTGFLRADEAIGRTSSELGLIDEELRHRLMNEFRLKGFLHNAEAPVRNRAGEDRVQLISLEMVHIGGRELVLTALQDITDRQRAQQAVRHSEDLLRAVTDNSPDAIYVKDRASRWLMANPAVLRIIGKTAEQAMGKTDLELYADPAIGQAILVNDRQVLATGQSLAVEEVADTPQGRRTFLSIKAPRRDAHGNITGIIGISHDITDRKRAEQALRKSQEDYHHLVEGSGSVILRSDKDLNITFMNQFGLEFFGYSADELLGRNAVGTIIPTRDEEGHDLAAMADDLRQHPDRYTTNAHQNMRKDGRLVWMSWANKAIYDDQGHLAEILAIGNDLSKLKRAEEALQKANDELERRVLERTAELSQTINMLQEEVALRTQAERALHERSEQLRALASELTLSEQRERRHLAEVLHDGLQQILVGAKFQVVALERSSHEEVRSAAAKINDLLSDSIETSRSLMAELSPPILLVGSLVQSLEWLARWMEDKHTLSVNLEAHDAIGTAAEDMTILLFQATRELLFNVVKHADVKTATVQVKRLDGHIQVTVSDEGAGFDPAQLKRCPGKSGGFGLFSIRERLDLLGGKLAIDSAPGRGSRFTLTAPLAAASHPPAAAQTRARISIEVTPPATESAGAAEERIRVLLVDDHMIMRQGLAGLLREERDMQIVGEASDGKSAVNMARKIRPDVVLMDLNMPGMSGIEATRIICAEMPELRIIGLSMFEEAEQAAAMLAAGAAAYVTKSGPSQDVIDAIRVVAPSKDLKTPKE